MVDVVAQTCVNMYVALLLFCSSVQLVEWMLFFVVFCFAVAVVSHAIGGDIDVIAPPPPPPPQWLVHWCVDLCGFCVVYSFVHFVMLLSCCFVMLLGY